MEKHKITLIDKNGKVTSSKDTFDPYKDDAHDFYFRRDICTAKWLEENAAYYDPNAQIGMQLADLTEPGNIFILDTTRAKVTNGTTITSIYIVTPALEKINDLQKQALKSFYPFFKEINYDHYMVEVVEDKESFDIIPFYDIDSFYEALGFNLENKTGKQK